MRSLYAEALFRDTSATLDDLCEAVTTLAEIEGTARRVLGGAQPITQGIERTLRHAQAALAVGDAEALIMDDGATLDDLREAVSTLEDAERTTRRVFGSSHPLAVTLERDLRNARAILSVRANAPTCVAIFAAAALALAAAYLARKKLP